MIDMYLIHDLADENTFYIISLYRKISKLENSILCYSKRVLIFVYFGILNSCRIYYRDSGRSNSVFLLIVGIYLKSDKRKSKRYC